MLNLFLICAYLGPVLITAFLAGYYSRKYYRLLIQFDHLHRCFESQGEALRNLMLRLASNGVPVKVIRAGSLDCATCRERHLDQKELIASGTPWTPLEDVTCPECGRHVTLLVPTE